MQTPSILSSRPVPVDVTIQGRAFKKQSMDWNMPQDARIWQSEGSDWYLSEANIFGVLTEALPADVESILPDQTPMAGADTATMNEVDYWAELEQANCIGSGHQTRRQVTGDEIWVTEKKKSIMSLLTVRFYQVSCQEYFALCLKRCVHSLDAHYSGKCKSIAPFREGTSNAARPILPNQKSRRILWGPVRG